MRVLIVEDEIDARKVLIYFTKQLFPEIEIVGEAASIAQAKKLITSQKPDLVLLDVRLEDGNAIDLLKQLKTIDFQIIFTTAYADYAIKAIKFDATDYLLKPINPDELKTAILKAQKQYAQELELSKLKLEQDADNNTTIAIKTAEQTYITPVTDIIRLEADGSYTSIITTKNTILASKNLKFYERVLSEKCFIRTHQSHLVNKKYITGISKDGFLKLSNQESVPISFRKKSSVRNWLKKKN